MEPQFTSEPERPGFVVVDPVQNRQLPVTTDRVVEPSACDPDRFPFPVESARSFVAGRLSFPYTYLVLVRDRDGDLRSEVTLDDGESFGPGEYVLELSHPLKMYLRVDGPFEVSSVDRRSIIELDGASRVEFGARSYHERPAGTVTVPSSPEGLLRGLPYLGSSLKDTTPERSFPTLRGHPPRLAFGEAFDVPEGIEPPETGVTVEVPPETDRLLEVAPLAYYLGADVVAGDSMRLTTDRGFERALAGDSPFESVKRTLEQAFTLDCIVRTEGLYPLDLHERDVLEGRVDWDVAALYERSLAEQLETYLSIPYGTVADLTPTWPLVANCRPRLSRAEMLPFVLHKLGLVRTVTFDRVEPSPEMQAEVDAFTRSWGRRRGTADGSAAERGRKAADGAAPEGGYEPADGPPDVPRGADEGELPPEGFVEVPPADAVEQVWLGDRWPLDAGRFLRAGFENKLGERDWTGGGESRPVEIAVVCNDEAMRREYADEALYGDRAELPFEVRTHLDATVEELREILGRRADFLHYIGHVEGSAFVCSDGALDVTDVEAVGARAFLLNGCRSLRLGPAMLEAGSVAGIVTLRDVGNRGAVEVGQHVARMLNAGYSVGGALDVVGSAHLLADQYVAVGDTQTTIVQNEGSCGSCYFAEPLPDGGYEITVFVRMRSNPGIGPIFTPKIDVSEKYFLPPKRIPGSIHVSGGELPGFIDDSTAPVLVDDELRWRGTRR